MQKYKIKEKTLLSVLCVCVCASTKVNGNTVRVFARVIIHNKLLRYLPKRKWTYFHSIKLLVTHWWGGQTFKSNKIVWQQKKNRITFWFVCLFVCLKLLYTFVDWHRMGCVLWWTVNVWQFVWSTTVLLPNPDLLALNISFFFFHINWFHILLNDFFRSTLIWIYKCVP